MLTPMTKRAYRITHTHRIPELVAQALRTAVSGRPGPAFLEIPIDVLFARIDEASAPFPARSLPTSGPRRPRPRSRRRSPAARGGAPGDLRRRRSAVLGAERELLAFAERTGIPVFSNGKAHGMVPADHASAAADSAR